MELDELKTGWNVLNEQLNQTEILNKRIIREMMENRTDSAYNKLLRTELLGCIVTALAIPFVVYIKETTVLTLGGFFLLAGVLAGGFIMQLFILSFLFRFDLEKKALCELNHLVLNYKLWVKRHLYIAPVVVLLTFAAFFIVEEKSIVHEAWRYCIVGVALLVLMPLALFKNYRFYKRNIAIIEKGLQELKEFEEE